MRSSEKDFSKRNCTPHHRHRRRHPVPFLILTCVRLPQRLQHRLPSTERGTTLDCPQMYLPSSPTADLKILPLRTAADTNSAPLGKNANLGGSTESRPTDSSSRKFHRDGLRSAQ